LLWYLGALEKTAKLLSFLNRSIHSMPKFDFLHSKKTNQFLKNGEYMIYIMRSVGGIVQLRANRLFNFFKEIYFVDNLKNLDIKPYIISMF
jgi:hypothetical protein